MIDNILSVKHAGTRAKVTVKSLIALFAVGLAVGLPQLVHLAAGAAGGIKWLPMFLPVLLAGCLLGPLWGAGVGLVAPAISFGITAAAGNAMPAAPNLPYMMAELAADGAISGLFSAKIYENGWMAFPAVLLGALAGRALFIILSAMFGTVSPVTVDIAWARIQDGLLGLVAHSVTVPLIVMAIRALTLDGLRRKVEK